MPVPFVDWNGPYDDWWELAMFVALLHYYPPVYEPGCNQ